METHFRVESARLAQNAEDELLRQSSDIKSLFGKFSALFSGRFTKALDVGGSSKSPSASVKKGKGTA